MYYLVTRLELLTRAANHLQTAALIAQLGGPQLLLGDGAAGQDQLGLAGPEEGEEAGLTLPLLLAHQLLQSLGDGEDVLVVLLHPVL